MPIYEKVSLNARQISIHESQKTKTMKQWEDRWLWRPLFPAYLFQQIVLVEADEIKVEN